MKNAIGLLLFGLLIRYGSADVSHLTNHGHNQYLPPPIQNLPIEQDYNGIDSQPQNERGYLPPHNNGYLPPYQDQHQQDHHHNQHHDPQHNQHNNNLQDQQQYQDPYDPSVQVSYHNDYAVHHPQGHVNDQSNGGHSNDDGHHDDHVQIDQQQLEPVNPSSFPLQEYLPPTAGPQINTHSVHNHVNPTVGPTRGESHSISLVHYHHNLPPVSSPAPFSLPQSSPSPVHNGYHYLPPPHPTPSLYPNEAAGVTDQSQRIAPGVEDLHHHTHQGPQQGYLPPSQPHSSQASPTIPVQLNNIHHSSPNAYSYQEQHRDYLPPTQSSHGNHGVSGHHSVHSHQEPQQNYLPPNQLIHGNPGVNSHSNHVNQQQGYLPPVQSNHVSGHVHQEPEQNDLPPNQLNHGHSGHLHQALQQDYIPPSSGVSNIHDHSGHSYRAPPSPLNHVNNNHHSGHSHQEPQQEHFPPIQSTPQRHSNHISPAGSPLLNHNSHQESQQDYLPPIQTNQVHPSPASQHHHSPVPSPVSHLHTSVANVRDNSGQSHQQPQQDYIPPNNAVDLPNTSGAIHEVPPPHLGPPHQEPVSQLTVRGHVNVPLPIPQVGYFFVPGVVSTLPSLTEVNNGQLRPALNIPAIISPQQPRTTQRISSPEYSRTFLLQKPNNNHPADQRTSGIVITPSIQTMQTLRQHSTNPQQNSIDHQMTPQSLGETLLAGLGYLPPQQDNRQTLVNYPQNQQQNGHHDHHDQHTQQNLNQGHLDHPHHTDQEYIPPDNLSNRGVSLQSIARTEVPDSNNQENEIAANNYQGPGYLPPVSDHHVQPQDQLQQQHNNHNDQSQDQNHQNANVNRGYLPPENHNQVTSLHTYMNGVHPNDRYGSSQYHQPPPSEKGSPPPPAVTSPPMFSKPSAIRAYAPGMAYKVSTNTPFSTFSPAAYLPPVENALPQDDQSSSIGFQLNEEAKRNLARIMPRDNTIFPLDELLGVQDNNIDVPQLMEQLRGRIRTVQIINNHANSVKNIRVLETADLSGVKTIKILGQSNEDPMGEHKVVRIISKGPNPEGIIQTVKIFADHKEVSLPTQNAYLPPPKAKEAYVRVLRHSQEAHRSH